MAADDGMYGVFAFSVVHNGDYVVKNKLRKVKLSEKLGNILADISEEYGKTTNLKNIHAYRLESTGGGVECELSQDVETIIQFDPNIRRFVFEMENVPLTAVNQVNAFTALMESARAKARPFLPQKKENTDAIKKLFNAVIDELEVSGARFPGSVSMNDGIYVVQAITNVLWYIDGCKETIHSAVSMKGKRKLRHIPDRFLPCLSYMHSRFFHKFNGFNDYKRKKVKKPQLSGESCKTHSNILFTVINRPYVQSWGSLAIDLEELAFSLQEYCDYLDSCNASQKARLMLMEPCRNLADDVTIEHRPAISKLDDRYIKLDSQLSSRDDYDPLCFSEINLEHPFKNRMERHRYFETLRLRMPVDILRYNPGGNLGTVTIIWKVPKERATDQLITDGARMLQMLRPVLPVYHTREMKASFSRQCASLGTAIPVHTMRSIYSHLTLDYSSDQIPAIDERVREGVLGDDPELVFDLRHLNKGRPGDTFKVFFEVLSRKVEEITAADDRRHGVAHFSEFISIADLRKRTAAECPEGTPIPSESTIMFSFMPRNMYAHSASLYTGTINLQHKVQTRQIRQYHVDAHYCAAVFKYMRAMAVKNKEYSMLLSIDDKSKIDIGEPGLPVGTGVRGKRTIATTTTNISCLDHDMQKKATLVPSVCLNIAIPEDVNDSFFCGRVSVTYKDAIFQPSSPFRHAAELKNEILRHRATCRPPDQPNPSILMLYSDGGPDHRITYESVKVSLICLFKSLNLDMLVAGRTAPGHSWANKVERVMSILNLGFQNCAFERKRCIDEIETYLKNCNSMEAIRKETEKHPEIKPAWLHSVQPVIELIENRTQRLALKDVPFLIHRPATEDQIQGMASFAQVLDPKLDTANLVKKEVEKCPAYQDYLKKHCQSHHYTFQIRKCDDLSCCGEKALPGNVPLHWLPDPVPSETDPEHYRPFNELYGLINTDESHRPSLKQETKRVAAAEQGCDTSMFTAQRVRMSAVCSLCRKPRCVYSSRKLTDRERNGINRTLGRYHFICGANVSTEGDVMEGIAFTNIRLNCESPIEYSYYSAKMGRSDLCCFCAATESTSDATLKKTYKVVLPSCRACLEKGLLPLKRQPFPGLKKS